MLVKSASTTPLPADIASANDTSSTVPVPAVVLPNTVPVVIFWSSATLIPPSFTLTKPSTVSKFSSLNFDF